MKILYIIGDHIYHSFGGLGSSVKEIIHSLVDKYDDIEIEIICICNVNEVKQYDKIKIISISKNSTLYKSTDPIISVLDSVPLSISTALRNIQKPDIIHFQDWTSVPLTLAILDYFDYSIKTVFSLQLSISMMAEELIKYKEDFFDAKSVEKETMKYAGALEQLAILKSNERIFLNKIDGKKSCIHGKYNVIHHGVDFNYINNLNFKKIELDGDNKIKVLFCGRLDLMKNILNLLRADIPEYMDLIIMGGFIGSNPDIFVFMSEVLKSKKNVKYIGFRSGEDKINCMKSADYGIFPSIYEPFGLVGLEFLACGTPLIASFVGGMNEYLTENCAIKIEDLSSEGISKTLYGLKDMSEDRKSKMIENGYNVCKKFTWESSADKHYNLYKKLLRE